MKMTKKEKMGILGFYSGKKKYFCSHDWQ